MKIGRRRHKKEPFFWMVLFLCPLHFMLELDYTTSSLHLFQLGERSSPLRSFFYTKYVLTRRRHKKNHSFEWFFYIYVSVRRTLFASTVFLMDNFSLCEIIYTHFSTKFVNRLYFILTPPSFASQNPPPLVQQVEALYFL